VDGLDDGLLPPERMPTVTVYGYMTPFESVRGIPPSLKRLRIWGCKAYILKPKAARRKDFDDKAYSGFHAGYADDERGYEIYIPELDKIVTSVHVLFNEVIPNPTDEYYRELQRLTVVTAEGPPRDPATYQYLVGLDHLDDEDGLSYKVTRIDKVKGYIVAYRRLVTPRASDTREELVPVHVADICRMTDDLVQSRKASVATPDGDSRPALCATLWIVRLSGLVRREHPMWTPVQAGIGSTPLAFHRAPLECLRSGAGKISLRI
jgi:hypothetical protein